MKKHPFSVVPFFTLANAAFLGLGMECLLNLLGFCLGTALPGSKSPIEEHPRFFAFCLVLGCVALLGLIGVLFASIKISEKFKYTKTAWLIQYIGALALSLPMMKLFEMLFDFLQKTF